MLRKSILVFLILVLFEGAIRKWLLPEYSNEVFLLKDFLLLGACFIYAQHVQKNIPLRPALAIFSGWSILAVFYAVVESSMQGLIGLRYYLAPLPLVLLVPALIREASDLERLATWAVRIAIPIGLLAIFQYLSPMDSMVNIYARGEEESISGFGADSEDMFSGALRARVTATFSYISTFTAFLTAAWLFAWISLLDGRAKLDRRIAAGALVLVAFNMAMTGSRGLFAVAILSGLPFAFLALRRMGALRMQLLALAVGGLISYVGVEIFEPFALTSLRGGAGEATERILAALTMPYYVFTEVGFQGSGMGSTFAGLRELGLRGGVAGFDDVNMDRAGVELGTVGYAAYLFLKLYLLGKTFAVFRRANAPALRHWALAAFLIQLGAGWQIPFHNAVAAIVYFASVGVVYWIEIEERKRREAFVPAYAPYPSWLGPAIRTPGSEAVGRQAR